MNLKRKKVIIAAGAQQIDKGIHRGLVIIIRIRTQKQSPRSTRSKPNYKKSSKMIIIEKSQHFKSNFAVILALEDLEMKKKSLLLLNKGVQKLKVFSFWHIINNSIL